MPLQVNSTKKFEVKFVKMGEALTETMTFDCLGRTDAKDELLKLFPGAVILDVWQRRT